MQQLKSHDTTSLYIHLLVHLLSIFLLTFPASFFVPFSPHINLLEPLIVCFLLLDAYLVFFGHCVIATILLAFVCSALASTGVIQICVLRM